MTKPAITRKLRCAIYTRKSSEEGLEQEFNSLHAQREACEAGRAAPRGESLPSGLEAASVRHARRAHRLTGATSEAAVEVRGKRRVGGGDLAALQGLHQGDPAAGAVCLVARREERGARLQAEPAVDAAVEPGEAAAVSRHRALRSRR